MFSGHYGVGFAARAIDPDLDLGLLFVATQAPDILWAVLNLLGSERTTLDPALVGEPAPLAYEYPYSHSLAGTIVQGGAAALATAVWRRRTGRRSLSAPLLVGATVCSHWALDWIVHRPDLPLWGAGRKVGLGLARRPRAAFATEAALLLGGVASALRGPATRRDAASIAPLGVFAAFLLCFQWLTTRRPPTALGRGEFLSMLASYGLFAGVASWLSRR